MKSLLAVQPGTRFTFLLLALLTAVCAGAATIAQGDVAVATGAYCCCITCPSDPPAYLLDHNGQTKQVLPAYGAVAFGPSGHLFGASRTAIVEYDTSLAIVRTIAVPEEVIRLAIAQHGDIFALSISGTLRIFSPAGVLEQTVALPGAGGLPASLDLGPDQCTVFYIDNSVNGRRFNICTAQPMAGLAPGTWLALRATSDGGYVAAANEAGTISVFDANNTLLRTYSTGYQSGSGLAFDTDPGFLWFDRGQLAKLQLTTGSYAGISAIGGASIAVNGEQRPASADFSTTVPALSPPLLFALAVGLMALAWLRLRA